jgi:2-oxoisovalerate dehydrogenase E1 component alpha subunit
LVATGSLIDDRRRVGPTRSGRRTAPTAGDRHRTDPAAPSAEVATFERYLGDRTGVRAETVEAPPLPAQTLERAWGWLRTARAVDQEAIYLQRQGHLGVYASSRGQEAAQVGASLALTAEDWVFPSYRELGCAIARGVPPEDILHPWRGTWFATHDPHEHRFGLLTIPLATQTLHAVGFALAGAHDGRDGEAVLCFLGDGATSEGDAHEAFNVAAVFGLPVVFVVQNNGYAISVPLERQTRAASLAHKAFGYGMAGYRCDGNDVEATHGAVADAVGRARRGDGPSLVEAVTYRMEAHTTSDDPRRYRSDDEVAAWRERDPINAFERRLAARQLYTAEARDDVEARAHAEAQRVRAVIESTPETDPQDVFAHVLAQPTPQLRRAAEEVARGFGD